MNAKSELIERLRAQGLGQPEYEVRVSGPDHQPVFSAQVYAGGELLAAGSGRTKRDAERAASEEALRALSDEGAEPEEEEEDEPGEEETGGVWPIYAELLSQSLLVAHERLPEDASLAALRRETRRLYTGLLGDLGVQAESPDADE